MRRPELSESEIPFWKKQWRKMDEEVPTQTGDLEREVTGHALDAFSETHNRRMAQEMKQSGPTRKTGLTHETEVASLLRYEIPPEDFDQAELEEKKLVEPPTVKILRKSKKSPEGAMQMQGITHVSRGDNALSSGVEQGVIAKINQARRRALAQAEAAATEPFVETVQPEPNDRYAQMAVDENIPDEDEKDESDYFALTKENPLNIEVKSRGYEPLSLQERIQNGDDEAYERQLNKEEDVFSSSQEYHGDNSPTERKGGTRFQSPRSKDALIASTERGYIVNKTHKSQAHADRGRASHGRETGRRKFLKGFVSDEKRMKFDSSESKETPTKEPYGVLHNSRVEREQKKVVGGNKRTPAPAFPYAQESRTARRLELGKIRKKRSEEIRRELEQEGRSATPKDVQRKYREQLKHPEVGVLDQLLVEARQKAPEVLKADNVKRSPSLKGWKRIQQEQRKQQEANASFEFEAANALYYHTRFSSIQPSEIFPQFANDEEKKNIEIRLHRLQEKPFLNITNQEGKTVQEIIQEYIDTLYEFFAQREQDVKNFKLGENFVSADQYLVQYFQNMLRRYPKGYANNDNYATSTRTQLLRLLKDGMRKAFEFSIHEPHVRFFDTPRKQKRKRELSAEVNRFITQVYRIIEQLPAE